MEGPEPMTVTALGPLLDQDGISAAREIKQGERGPQLYVNAWATPADLVRRTQPARIPIDYAHDENWLGEVVDLQLRGRFLWCIAHLKSQPPEWAGPWFWSAKSNARESDGGDAVIEAVALTTHPRQIALRQHPLRFYDGALDYREAAGRWQLDPFQKQLLTRAAASRSDRRASGRDAPIIVGEPDRERAYERAMRERSHGELAMMAEDDQWSRRPPGRMRYSAPYKGILSVR
jgi:hypothetical protein